jgi:hypothetical protein
MREELVLAAERILAPLLPNQALHPTAIPLRFIAAGEFGVS